MANSSESSNDFDRKCIICSSRYSRFFDLRDKAQIAHIEEQLQDPSPVLEKVLKAVKFQDLHTAKYVSHLEQRVATLQLQNQQLQ